MSYAVSYRKRVIAYRQEGHTLEETSRLFEVSVSTIRKWERQLKDKGHLENKPLVRGFKKIDPAKLKAYLDAHPEAYQASVAKAFGCTDAAVRKAFNRLGIVRKKHRTGPKPKPR